MKILQLCAFFILFSLCLSSDPSYNDFNDIVYSNSKYITVGIYNFGYHQIMYTSSDAKNWSLVINLPELQSLECIIYFKGLFYTVGGKDSIILISTDTINWKAIYKNINFEYLYNIQIITLDISTVLIATGSNGLMLSSLNGVNFSKMDNIPTNEIITSVAFGKGTLIGIADNSNKRGALIYTNDTQLKDWKLLPIKYQLESIVYSNKYKLFIAGGSMEYGSDTAIIIVSSDGQNWNIVYNVSRSSEPLKVNHIAYNEDINLLVAVGDEIPILYSNDGYNWHAFDPSEYPTPTDDCTFVSAAIYPPKIIIVGNENNIWVSEDTGKHWKNQSPRN